MKLKYSLSIFLILILRSISYSQIDKGNLELIDKLIDEGLNPVVNKVTILGEDKLYELIADTDNDVSSYIQKRFAYRLSKYKLILGENSDSAHFKIIISNPVIKVRYPEIFTDNLLGTKRVQRVVSVSYTVQMKSKSDSSVIYNAGFERSLKDSFDLDKLSFIEDRRFPFSQSKLPEESSLDKILFPALIVLASAATIILFFIIRSK